MADIWPLTIVKDRYDGVYSGGKWTAWNMNHWKVPKAVNGDDHECASLCAIYNAVYGRGETPQEAIDDLKFMINYGVHIPMERIKEVNNADEDIETAFQIGLLFGKADKAIEEVEKAITPEPSIRKEDKQWK